jgi:hypothetical protein
MDLEAAKQISRRGFADANAGLRHLLSDLDPPDRADIDQCAAAITTTLQANDLPVNATTARVFAMAVAMVGVEILKHHGNTYPTDLMPCLEVHHLRCELAAALVLQQQEGAGT